MTPEAGKDAAPDGDTGQAGEQSGGGLPELPGLPGLLRLLDLEGIDSDLFLSRAAGAPGHRLFGGQVAAQALVAAERTSAGGRAHSLHTYFLRSGDTGKPVVYQVERLQDGRTFRRRRVTATQEGHPILCLEASFTTDQATAEHQIGAPPVPDPESCPPMVWRHRATGFRPDKAFDLRAAVPAGGKAPHFSDDLWFRTRGGWPGSQAGPVSAAAVLTYISDLTFISVILRPHGRPDVSRLTSLDHVVWIHNEVRLDDWLLFVKTTPAAGVMRGLALGSIFHRDGTLIATVAQEGIAHHSRPGD